MDLRYYQAEAVQSVLTTLKTTTDNPCVEIPTGGGKTPVIATLCDVFTKAGARTLCVAHRKELLEQTVEKLRLWAPNAKDRVTIVSAGLGEREYSGAVVVAGVQSIYKQTEKLLSYGKIDFVIVDEAHLIPTTDENASGMYQTLLQELSKFNPKLRVIGLTATPYRLSSGTVCGDDKILSRIVYKVGVTELIANGMLSPLVSKAPVEAENNFTISHGEYNMQDVNAKYNVDSVVFEACSQIARLTKNRKKVLVFCCGREHCQNVARTLSNATSQEVGVVLGDTPQTERDGLLRRFKDGPNVNLFGETEQELKYLCNVDVLTTGFDAPNVDCVVLLRPTASPGLYYQMCGRGFRLYPEKENCLVLDFAGNIQNFGPIDKLEAPTDKKKTGKKDEPSTKICPICFSAVPKTARKCPDCGNKLVCDDFICPSCNAPNDLRNNFCCECGFKFREASIDDGAKHDGVFDSTGGVLSTGVGELPLITEKVERINYYIHESRKSGKTSLRVEYVTQTTEISEYICFEHEGFAKEKARRWWAERSTVEPVPVSVRQAYNIIQACGIGEPNIIDYRPKKPGDFQPKIVYNSPKERRLVTGSYPRTDNPLNITCQECGAQSFTYERERGVYTIRCAKCEAVFANDLESEIDSIESIGVKFYDPEIMFWDSALSDASTPNDTSLEDDIPF